jgi:hypothetical protein
LVGWEVRWVTGARAMGGTRTREAKKRKVLEEDKEINEHVQCDVTIRSLTIATDSYRGAQ